jgi:hypothetical protein
MPKILVVNNILEVRIYSTDNDSHAILDESYTVKPNGNVRIFFNDALISETLGFDHPAH